MTKCLANINVCGLLFHRILEFGNLSSLITTTHTPPANRTNVPITAEPGSTD